MKSKNVTNVILNQNNHKQHTAIYSNINIQVNFYNILSNKYLKNNTIRNNLQYSLPDNPIFRQYFSLILRFLFNFLIDEARIIINLQNRIERSQVWKSKKLNGRYASYIKQPQALIQLQYYENYLISLSFKFTSHKVIEITLLVENTILLKKVVKMLKTHVMNTRTLRPAVQIKIYQQGLETSFLWQIETVQSLYTAKILFRLQSIFKKHEMNIITILPNYYSNQIIHTPLLYNPPTLKVPPLLILISQALKSSIISYENALSANKLTPTCEIEKEISSTVPFQDELSPKLSTVEPKQRKQKTLKQQKINSPQKEEIPIAKVQKPARDSSQHITNESSSQEVDDKKQKKKNTRELSHRIKKDKTSLRKRHGHIKISNINLLEAADIPRLGFEKTQLDKKRQSLFCRRVQVWDQKYKDKTNRREIRMLNF